MHTSSMDGNNRLHSEPTELLNNNKQEEKIPVCLFACVLVSGVHAPFFFPEGKKFPLANACGEVFFFKILLNK